MTGHLAYSTTIDLDVKIFPGMNEQHSLISREFFRCRPDQPYVRHDLRVWENAGGRGPQLRDASGKLLMGDALIADWRTRTSRGTARVRGYFDVHPDRDSRLTLDAASKNRWGDPLPAIRHQVDAATQARAAQTREHFQTLFGRLAKENDGRMGNVSALNYQDHPCGGCRMGGDPATSVVDSHGRTHDHENLFVVGSPTLPTGGCTNGTLTFVALALRSVEALQRWRRASALRTAGLKPRAATYQQLRQDRQRSGSRAGWPTSRRRSIRRARARGRRGRPSRS
jgi:quinoprotein glucose dehydrogenase